jgi:nicotinate phosphoribosyltransferase
MLLFVGVCHERRSVLAVRRTKKDRIDSLESAQELDGIRQRRFFSAEHDDIQRGATTDIYFVKSQDVLKRLELEATSVTAEIFASRPGMMAGNEEVLSLLEESDVEVWMLPSGEDFDKKEVIMRIRGPYSEFGIYETPLLGILASSAGWATAAREVKEAAQGKPAICFGARHVHPSVAPVMERAALLGGMDGVSCILAAHLVGRDPTGTIPHAAIIIAGDTLAVARAYDQTMPPDEPRIILVDTFKDEVEETLRVAEELGPALEAVRLDTPSERGRVTPGLVREVRARLDQKGRNDVDIFVSGGLTPPRITELIEAGADGFGVGSYISAAPPIDMTMDIKEVDGQPRAKRGRIPGTTATDRLEKCLPAD